MTSSYQYHERELCLVQGEEFVPLHDITKTLSLPTYLYNLTSVKRRLKVYKSSLEGFQHQLHYALKANSCPEVLKVIKDSGCGADAVSLGEVKYALKHGFKAEDIILSGVAKPRAEIEFCLSQQIKQINVESLSELRRVLEVAQSLSVKAKFGVRLNPDIKVETHPYISTGFRENKFGLPEEQISTVIDLVTKNPDHLDWVSVSAHIGSQIRQLSPLVDSCRALIRVCKNLKSHNIHLQRIDLGGGIGIDYKTNDETNELNMIQKFGEQAKACFSENNLEELEIMLEPGRSITARSGVLLTQIEYIKNNGFKNFIIVNSGMNHLLRPSLYQAYHRILPLTAPSTAKSDRYDIVGPICESSDVLGYDRSFTNPQEGQWLAVMDSGSYGATMSSSYNMHPLPKEHCL